jgi:ribosomal protein S18 acetylase RimI-like enzyme
MRISISNKSSNVSELTEFFVGNLTPSYISHSELQGFRAVRPGVWADDVESVVRTEIRKRLRGPLTAFPAATDWKGVIEARNGGRLIGLALVTLSRRAVAPFAIIEDIVVDHERRDNGIGQAVMDWIVAELRKAAIRRVFLESGETNTAAHHFFERLGFRQISIVMMRDLDP